MKAKFRAPKLADTDVTAESQEVQEAETPEAEVKPATEPWNPESAPDHASKRGMLGVSRLKKGFELRWVRYDSIDRRKNQGYTLATPEEFNATPDENGMIRRNELVLMIVPKEVYDTRRKEIAKMNETQAGAPRSEFLRERNAASRQSGHNLSDQGDEE